ncbi:MAG: acyl-CoA dehydrogenase family protein [Clostridiaceae bacterium]|nr:acyl-CoA dehydrogenase family protein [Clostridiaceae bacterium]
MDFGLTKQQEFVKQMVREFTINEVEPLAAEIDISERFPRETVEKMARYNMMGIPIATKYGGAGGNLGQELKFTAPVRFGDTIKAEVEVIEKLDAKNIMKLSTTCTNQDGAVVLKGIATVMPPK